MGVALGAAQADGGPTQGPGFIDNLRFIDNYREFNFNDKIYFVISESKKSFAPKHTSVYSFLKNSAWNHHFNPLPRSRTRFLVFTGRSSPLNG